jgi:hypothetical protein
MARRILAVLSGLVVWVAITTIAGLIIRATWPAYVAVADAMTFTLPMMVTRLSIGALATVLAGGAAALVARQRTAREAFTTGVVLLVLFIPQHIFLWTKFPVWYHLTFLCSLVPLAYLGGRSSLLRPLVNGGGA